MNKWWLKYYFYFILRVGWNEEKIKLYENICYLYEKNKIYGYMIKN